MAGCGRCGDPSAACSSLAIRKPSARKSAPLALELERSAGQREGVEEEERALRARQFGVIDTNHYREHGRGWQRPRHHFAFGHLFRQRPGQTHTERGFEYVSTCATSGRGTERTIQGRRIPWQPPPEEESTHRNAPTPPTYAVGNVSFSSKEDGSIQQIDTYSAQTSRHVMKGKIDPTAGGQLTEEL